MMKRMILLVLLLSMLVEGSQAAITFVNATKTNTESANALWTAANPTKTWYAGRTPPQWRNRDDIDGVFGIFAADEDTYAGNAEWGLGTNDYIMIKTTISGLVPYEYYNIYLNFASGTTYNWSIMGGLSPDAIEGFAKTTVTLGGNVHIGTDDASGRVTDTGRTNGAYPIYRALLGVAVANASGEIVVYVDDTNNVGYSPIDRNRCWYDGVEYELSGPPRGTAYSPAPIGTINKDTEYTGYLSWTSPDVPDDPNLLSVNYYDVYLYPKTTGNVTGDDPNALKYVKVSSAQAGTTYTMALDYNTTYFWRVDTNVTWDSNEVTGGALTETITGADWQFATLASNAFPAVTVNGDLLTSLDFSPVALLTGNVDDNGEGDMASVKWSIVSYDGGALDTNMQMYDRTSDTQAVADITEIAPAELNLLIDWIGTDARTSAGGGDPMILTLKGLPAGTYSWKSYHHDGDNQTGLFDVTVVDSTGSFVAGTGIDISDANTLPITAFETTFVADGSDVKLIFDQQNDQSLPIPEMFFVMNGFELTKGADSLKVDFTYDDGTTQGPVQADFSAYGAKHEDASSFTQQDFSAFGTTVSVLPTWNDYVVGASLTPEDGNPAEAAQATSFVTDTPGTYTIALSAIDTAGQEDFAETTVTVYADACTLAQDAGGWQGFNEYDKDMDCDVDLLDFAEFAKQWLDDVSASGQIEL